MSTASPENSPRAEQSARTRDRVLEVASDLMARHGYSGTTISAISKASGVMPASIYWHFDSKEGLLAAVIDRAADVWFREVESVMAGVEGEDARQKMLAGLRFLFQKPEFYRLLLLISLERRDSDTVSVAAVRRVRDRRKKLAAARLAERVPIADPAKRTALCDQLAELSLVLLDGIFVAHQIDPVSDDRLMERFEQIAWVMKLARDHRLLEAGVSAQEIEELGS